jgi:hypothetical protein
MLAHLRTEAYPGYRRHFYPPQQTEKSAISFENNLKLIEQSKAELNHDLEIALKGSGKLDSLNG